MEVMGKNSRQRIENLLKNPELYSSVKNISIRKS
jgi:hypothetical protein